MVPGCWNSDTQKVAAQKEREMQDHISREGGT